YLTFDEGYLSPATTSRPAAKSPKTRSGSRDFWQHASRVSPEVLGLLALMQPQILILYDLLLQVAPSPIARLNRAVALRYVVGPDQALDEVDGLERQLDGYHLFHAIRADLLNTL